MKRNGLSARLRYRFDASMTRGTPALVGWLALATLGIILLAAALIVLAHIVPRGDDGMSASEALWESLMRAMDPGTLAGDTGWPFRFLMLGVTFAGIFIFSALIGILSTGLNEKLEQLRKGRSLVLEREHTIIYNWSPSIFDVIAEIAVANESRRRPRIVVLASRDKVEMEEEIARKIPALGRTRVICRTGDTTDLDELTIANPQAARSIIILSRDDAADPDSDVIKTLLALTNDPARAAHPYGIAAEIRDARNAEVARVVGGKEAQLILADELIARIIVQSTRQPGLSTLFADLLNFDGSEIYTVEQPSLVGRTFGEAIFSYDQCALIGLRTAEGRILLNPADATHIDAGSRLVLIAEDDSTIAPLAAPRASAALRAPELRPRAPAPERVLMIGWNRRAPLIVRELMSTVAAGSTLTIAAERGLVSPAGMAGSDQLAIDFREIEPGRRADIEALDPASYSDVLVLGSDTLPAQAADTRTLVTLLFLRHISESSGVDLHVVSEMIDVRNRKLAEVTQVNDFVVSNKLVSLMLAQASEDPNLEAIFEELLTSIGTEICFRPAAAFAPAGEAVSFHQVAATARTTGELAIGWDRAPDGVRLNPPRNDAVMFAPGDRIIVLADASSKAFARI